MIVRFLMILQDFLCFNGISNDKVAIYKNVSALDFCLLIMIPAPKTQENSIDSKTKVK